MPKHVHNTQSRGKHLERCHESEQSSQVSVGEGSGRELWRCERSFKGFHPGKWEHILKGGFEWYGERMWEVDTRLIETSLGLNPFAKSAFCFLLKQLRRLALDLKRKQEGTRRMDKLKTKIESITKEGNNETFL